MDSTSNNRVDWSRWIPRAFFILAILSRPAYTVYYHLIVKEVGFKYWDFGIWGFLIVIIIVTGIAWFFPISGGILALISIPVFWVFIWLTHFFSSIDDPPLTFETIFFGAGALFSIVWGITERKIKKENG